MSLPAAAQGFPSASDPARLGDAEWLESLATPVWLLDAEDRLAFVNTAAVHALGRSARRLVGQCWSSWLEPECSALFAEAAQRARMSARRIVLARARIVQVEGAEHFADVSISPLSAPHAGVLLIEAHPLGEFPGSDPAEILPAALHASLRGLAHEVRNPLAGLRGAAQLLERRIEDGDARRCLEVIRAETDRLQNLVERLLEPRPAQPPIEVNLHAVVERVRFLLEAEAGWSVRILRDYDPSLPVLSGEPDRLIQAVLNLARNALEAGAGEIGLRTRLEHGARIGEAPGRHAIRLDVIDNGCGVPDALQERLFLPLVSGRSDGTGIGLTLAQEIAREHGGTLTFRSRPGHTVFTLMLPLPALATAVSTDNDDAVSPPADTGAPHA